MRSEDGGNNWELIFRNNQYYATFQGWYSHAIAIHPKDSNIVWAAGQPFDIYKSEVGGDYLTMHTFMKEVQPER